MLAFRRYGLVLWFGLVFLVFHYRSNGAGSGLVSLHKAAF